jgi:hypothetical protein
MAFADVNRKATHVVAFPTVEIESQRMSHGIFCCHRSVPETGRPTMVLLVMDQSHSTDLNFSIDRCVPAIERSTTSFNLGKFPIH